MKRSLASLLPVLCIILPGCQGGMRTDLPVGVDAYSVIPAQNAAAARPYRIGALDMLTIQVYGEPELSVAQAQVNVSGLIQMPFIQEVQVAGLTPAEARDLIARRLGERYVVNPQVVVSVTTSASLTVTVEGSVADPGIYQIAGSTTLLDALALANSPVRGAKLDQVVVFRVIDGRRAGAVFDLRDIRSGRTPDPTILAGDKVVVGYDALQGTLRDFVGVVPLLAIFRFF
jgi:polysaccharide export outer membrane protein